MYLIICRWIIPSTHLKENKICTVLITSVFIPDKRLQVFILLQRIWINMDKKNPNLWFVCQESTTFRTLSILSNFSCGFQKKFHPNCTNCIWLSLSLFALQYHRQVLSLWSDAEFYNNMKRTWSWKATYGSTYFTPLTIDCLTLELLRLSERNVTVNSKVRVWWVDAT